MLIELELSKSGVGEESSGTAVGVLEMKKLVKRKCFTKFLASKK